MSRLKESVITMAVIALVLGSRASLAEDMNGDRWKFTVAPYLWGTSVDGTIAVNQRKFDASADFNDLVEFADSGGALRFEARRRWGFFADVWFASLSDKQDTPIGRAEFSFDQTISEAGLLYAFRRDLTGYLGARNQDIDGDLKIPVVGKLGTNENWTDAIVGLRYTPMLSDRWQGTLRADAGTGDSDFTWLAQVGIGYLFSKRWSGHLAYRYMDTDLEKGNFEWNLAQSGLGLGLVYQF